MEDFLVSQEQYRALRRGGWTVAAGLLILILASILYRASSATATSQSNHQINLMGRQRMLSQWITKQVVLLRMGIVDGDRGLPALEENFARWKRVQAGLESGDPELRLVVSSSNAVVASLWETRQSMNAIESTLRPLFEGVCRKQPTSCALDLDRLLDQEQRFLKAMDRAVSLEVDNGAEMDTARASRQYMWMALSIGFVFAYGGYIVWRLPRPAGLGARTVSENGFSS